MVTVTESITSPQSAPTDLTKYLTKASVIVLSRVAVLLNICANVEVLLHSYLLFPPETVKDTFSHTFLLPAITNGSVLGLTINVIVPVLLQLFALVTVTIYVDELVPRKIGLAGSVRSKPTVGDHLYTCLLSGTASNCTLSFGQTDNCVTAKFSAGKSPPALTSISLVTVASQAPVLDLTNNLTTYFPALSNVNNGFSCVEINLLSVDGKLKFHSKLVASFVLLVNA